MIILIKKYLSSASGLVYETFVLSWQVYSPLGRLSEALSDINVALDLEPTSQLYLMSGTLLFMQEVRE